MKTIDAFNFPVGKKLAKKYEVIEKIGEGYEGEVYLIRELATGIERAAKFFFPVRNPKNKSLVLYAKKLHKLQHCPLVIHYHTQETILFKGYEVVFLVSEYVQGQLLSEFLKSQPGKRLTAFQSLHLLHALVKGVRDIHNLGEYHGDLHLENIIVKRFGLGFDLKVIDMYNWGRITPEHRRDDIFDVVRVFYDAVGGKKHYAKQPQLVKDICCGLKRSLITKKFKRLADLKAFIESADWE